MNISLGYKTPLVKPQKMINTSLEIHKGRTPPLNPTKDEDTSLESHKR